MGLVGMAGKVVVDLAIRKAEVDGCRLVFSLAVKQRLQAAHDLGSFHDFDLHEKATMLPAGSNRKRPGCQLKNDYFFATCRGRKM